MADSPLSADARTLAAERFARFGEHVATRLLRRYRGVDPDAVTDAVVEAILAAPADEPDVTRFLYSFARQRLRVVLRGNSRRRHREEKYSRLPVTAGRTGDPSPIEALAGDELAAELRTRIAPSAEDRAVLDFWLAGVTDPTELAKRLGYPPGESGRAMAVTVLARLRKRIQRERDRQPPDDQDDDP